MNATQAAELLGELRARALSLPQVHEWVRLTGSPWTVDQVALFLRCAPGVELDAASGTYRVLELDPEAELQEALLAAVRSFAGRPVPAVEVRKRLPDRFSTTDESVLALARRTRGLQVFGPNLIRLSP